MPFILLSFLYFFSAHASDVVPAQASMQTLQQKCIDDLKAFPVPVKKGESKDKALEVLTKACEKVTVFDECKSAEGELIYHYSKQAVKDPKNTKIQNVLVFSLIHGDETPAGSVGRLWMERLESIDPRNNWRVIPILNPDGLKLKTRTNANKVDINRNFPTTDWDKNAEAYWKKHTNSNPRRFPGKVSASEPETKCAMKHMDEFKPDFVVSIHTPLKVLDFDGPKVKPPKYDYLPWKSLGNYTGSMGRFMWVERNVPVLTMELKEDLPANEQPLVQLQDIIGVLVGLETNSGNSSKK